MMGPHQAMRRLGALLGIPACVFLLLSSGPVQAYASDAMGMVNVVKVDPSTPTTVFAGANRGVFKSVDGGASWTATAVTEPTFGLAIDYVTPAVYAGTGSGLFKSVDGGTNWIAARVSERVCSVEVDPASPTTVYASTCSQIVKSMDGGSNWDSVGPTDGPTYSLTIAAGPPMIFYGVDGIRVVSSRDGGATWSVGSNPDEDYLPLMGLYGFSLAIDPGMSTTAYVSYWGWSCDSTACFTTGAITASTDGGVTWFAVDRLLYYGSWVSPQVVVSPVAIDPLASGVFYTAWNVSCDQFDPNCVGDHWISKNTDGRISDLSAFALWFDPLTRTIIYAATDSGVLQSVDGGITWSPTGSQPPPPPPPSDTTPPDTSITSAVDGTGSALANDAVTLSASLTLTFTGADNVGLSRLECQLDGTGFNACASPLVYNALPLDRHTFEVRAVDTSSNLDPSPARYTWTVDAPPDTVITAAIDGRGKSIANGGTARSDRMTFSFTGTDNGTVSSFECQLDAASFAPCTSPARYTGVSRGTHTFRVQAIDNNGFRDPSPATFTWSR